MNTPSRIVTPERRSDDVGDTALLIRLLLVVFVGTLTTGVLATLGFSASVCLLNRAIPCFLITRDAIDIALIGMMAWALPALIAGFLIMRVVRLRGSVAWWNVLIVAPVSFLMLAMLMGTSIGSIDVPELLLESVILFVGVHLSLFVNKSVGKVRI